MPIVEIKGIPPVNQGPVQEVFDYEEEWDEDEFIVSKKTRNKRLDRSLKRADRRARYENYKELE